MRHTYADTAPPDINADADANAVTVPTSRFAAPARGRSSLILRG